MVSSKDSRNNKLNDDDYQVLDPWNDIEKPNLQLFQRSITAIIEEKGFKSEIEDE